MSSERWRLVERLYHAALERPAAARPAFLADACAGDEALARDVQSLLDQVSIPGFLDEPALAVALAAAADTPDPPWVGRHIGVYHLQSLLGAAAWARSTARATRGSAATSRSRSCRRRSPRIADRLARFEREARAARLAQPSEHRARSTASRKPTARRALVLELVEGETLARAARARAAADRRGARDRAADRRRARSRARQGHRPSRSEAGQHQDHAGRRGQGARLRAGEEPTPGGASRAGRRRRRSRSAAPWPA